MEKEANSEYEQEIGLREHGLPKLKAEYPNCNFNYVCTNIVYGVSSYFRVEFTFFACPTDKNLFPLLQ